MWGRPEYAVEWDWDMWGFPEKRELHCEGYVMDLVARKRYYADCVKVLVHRCSCGQTLHVATDMRWPLLAVDL